MKQLFLNVIVSLGAITFSFSQNDTMNYNLEKVSFKSHSTRVVGFLGNPGTKSPKPAIVILGPICSVKEMSPIQYATRLAKLGFVTLCFDARNFGESDGTPRQFESLKLKEEDIKSAVDYLISKKEVDTNRLFLLGICNGTNEIISVATEDKRIKAISLVSGNYLIKENMVHLLGDETIWNTHLQRARIAKEKFDKKSEVQYIKIVDNTGTDQLLPQLPIYEWYHPWENKAPYFGFRGGWKNEVTAMSEWETLHFNALDFSQKLRVPTLLIHGEMSDGGYEYAKQIFNSIPAKNKKAIWEDKMIHFQYYEDAGVIDRATENIADWFNQY